MTIDCTGSVRIDLLGGTLDIPPIQLIIPNVVTLNLAATLKARVKIEKIENKKIIIKSLDYDSIVEFDPNDLKKENFNSDFFGPLKFTMLLINHFGIKSGYRFEMSSGSPAGAGLGGSSTMGVVLFKALCELSGKIFDPEEAIKITRDYECIILNQGPAGYQDYYPAVYGGVLALLPQVGKVEVEQLFDPELKKILESRLTLIYSGDTRNSGINNWEVYKGFFDGAQETRSGLEKIANLAYGAYLAIKERKYPELLQLIGQEGAVRKELFPGIVSPSMDSLYNELKRSIPGLAMKVCGAGGGGCFLLIHEEEEREAIIQQIKTHPKMKILDFQVEPPL